MTPRATSVSTRIVTVAARGTAEASSRLTGIVEVDAVIDAVESRNVDAILSLVHYTDLPCTSTPLPAEYIHCVSGQPEASPAAAFLVAACEGTFMVNSNSPAIDLRKQIGAVDGRVFAVYRAGASDVFRAGHFPAVDYAVVLTFDLQGRAAGLALLVGSNGIVGIDTDCGVPPAQMAETERFGEVVLQPQ